MPLVREIRTEKILKDIEDTLNAKDSRIKYLENENKKLRDEHYKDGELSKMKDELERNRKDMFRGFPISEKEEQRIKEWKLKHETEDHGLDTPEKRLKSAGCCGGRYTYEFFPCAIGTSGVVKCSCGKEFEFQSL